VLRFELGDRLRAAANSIAEATLARDYSQRPVQLERYGEVGRTKYRQDILFNVAALAGSVDADDVGIFLRYVAWLKIVLLSRGVAFNDIVESLHCMAGALTRDTGRGHAIAVSHLEAALEEVDSMPMTVASFIGTSSEEENVAQRCLDAMLLLDAAGARESLREAIAAGTPLAKIYSVVLPLLMREVGRLWQMNKISVAHEHYCSAAVQSILASFYGLMFDPAIPCGRSLLVACVEAEQHELGARILADIFQLNGWHTNFLGANLPSRELVTLIKRAPRLPDLVALCATMPEHLAQVACTIAAIRDGSNLPIMVGGYLFHENPGLAAQLGADGCADDAETALGVADGLVTPV
jgi:methanogenic corrinoid protein MtbC1